MVGFLDKVFYPDIVIYEKDVRPGFINSKLAEGLFLFFTCLAER